MKKKIQKQIQKILDDKFQSYSEFIVNEIAPELEEEDFDIDEIVAMVLLEADKRNC